ncbi:hypothetical protein MMC26_006243 [Xylographa opegraphella]|nr:hypothetical protein [Xylographa opegraphella]
MKLPSTSAMPPRRFLPLLTTAAAIILCLTIYTIWNANSPPIAYRKPGAIHHVSVADSTLKGDAIMGKLGNETLKAELGRASWKLFHTTMARFPDAPSEDEQTALFSYIHLFARLYPCGECAGHFRQILTKFPPQVKTRSTAAAWACHVHNEVNKSLSKPMFDCSNIGDFYDCGCAEEAGEGKGGTELKLEREG